MALPDPESASEREQLRAYLEAHPGQPEVALAKHLLDTRPYIEDPSAGAGPERRSSNGQTSPDRPQ